MLVVQNAHKLNGKLCYQDVNLKEMMNLKLLHEFETLPFAYYLKCACFVLLTALLELTRS